MVVWLRRISALLVTLAAVATIVAAAFAVADFFRLDPGPESRDTDQPTQVSDAEERPPTTFPSLADAAPCTNDSILATWGAEPGLDLLAVDVQTDGDECIVVPASFAASWQITETELAEAALGEIPDKLRVCTPDSADWSLLTSCSSLHTVELIGKKFTEEIGVDYDDYCQERMTKYIGASPNAQPQLRHLIERSKQSGIALIQCGVYAENQTLLGSVRDIGRDPLPR